ncbi:MAG TPA: virulence-associated E family protein [Flavobacterium sp.]|nr:virulence-associated E family protein [Flavobacterium sp.]
MDGLIDIMIGRSRFEKRWQHKEMKWSALVKKLSVTQRTHETYKEYIRSKPDRQANIKDIGGFVGGLMTGGRRKNGSVIHRQLITLDADNDPEIDDIVAETRRRKITCCIYSTHKHSIEKSRLRLIIPISRPVDIDEYEAIARKVADWYGIDYFDPTTFQPTRLMYWPSTSKDGTYYFKDIPGIWINADKVLNEYDDWTDTTLWPVSTLEKDKVKTLTTKQADPLEKVGMIGSFCRTYTIDEVIEKYLSDVYEKGTTEGRYTYKAGTTANGLVVYDDVFAYSHHSTDPISGVLCNAWDLVRLHKFGPLDDNYNGTGKKPSVVAMHELASLDSEVKTTIGKEKILEAQELFGDIDVRKVETVTPDAWLSKMEVDGKANYLNTINNVVLILENDPAFKSKFRYNDLKKCVIIDGKLPWRGIDGVVTQLVDEDYAALRHYLELIYRITASPKIDDAVAIVAKKNTFHPIRDWIEGIKWDGKKRAEELFITYLGVNDSAYTRMVSRKSLLACIYRIFEPGCKFENMLVLIGDQGIGKSTIISRLGHEWHSDSLTNIGSKESFEQLRGAWIIEFSELNSIRNADVEMIKHFLSKVKDDYRPSYGRVVQSFHRQCVFFGTTNSRYFLKDTTGNRRFWPLVCELGNATEDIFSQFNLHEVEQVWAEVYTWYLMGEQMHLPLATEYEARRVQSKHMEVDDRLGAVEEFLNIRLPDNWYELGPWEKRGYLDGDSTVQNGKKRRDSICAMELYCELFRGTYRDFNTRVGRDMFALLKQLIGWELQPNKKTVPGYGRQNVFERIKIKKKVK